MTHESAAARPAAAHAYLVLSRANRAVEARALRSIARLGLGATDFGVLEALLHKGPLPVNVLGRKLLLTSGSITVAVDRLVRRGCVERRDDARDRRVRLVELTAHGRELIEAAFARHAADLEAAMAALTPEELATLVRLLRKLGQAAEQGSGERRSEMEEAS
ncbi:MAG TPA: MarR family winged helix-turn-helix transcriptional regulator [Gemmatimonadaceae bacterium]|nr:MarR family winged helix-turn-helix transcriptional regulator [Gemmatimonadaceae bacterium]